MHTPRLIDEPWPLRIMAIAVLASTYFFSLRPLMETREALAASTQENINRTMIAEHTIRNADKNIALARNIRSELGNVRMDVDENTALSAFLIDTDRIAGKRNIQILGVDPMHDTMPHAKKNELTLGLHVRGRYGDVLHFTGDLSMIRSLVEIRAINLVRDAKTVRAGASPDIDASIKLAIIRLDTMDAGPTAADHSDLPKASG